MARVAFKMTLNPGQKDEYKRRHDQIWAELKTLLKSKGISDYTIFLDEETNTLFGVQQQEGGLSSQDLSDHPVIKEWWAYMADIMMTNSDNSPVSVPLTEVFHMD